MGLGKLFKSDKEVKENKPKKDEKSKKKGPPTTQDAIQDLRNTEELLMKKQAYLESRIGMELDIARKHGSANKKEALKALNRKRTYEKNLQQLDGTLQTVEFQRMSLENASTNAEVLKVMGDASKSLKVAQKHMDVDDVHNLLDDIAEGQELSAEISNILSNNMLGDSLDDDDLLAELEALELEEYDRELEEKRREIPAVSLPDAPSRPLPVAAGAAAAACASRQHHKEEDLEELSSWSRM